MRGRNEVTLCVAVTLVAPIPTFLYGAWVALVLWRWFLLPAGYAAPPLYAIIGAQLVGMTMFPGWTRRPEESTESTSAGEYLQHLLVQALGPATVMLILGAVFRVVLSLLF